MSTIVTRAGKGSALTHNEVDANFTNLNTDKIEAAQTVTLTNKTLGSGTAITAGTINNASIGATTPSTGAFTNLSYTGTLTGGTGVINIGSGQVYKDANGNVGIGTSSPSYKLHVANSSATSTTLLANILARFQSNASGADASLQFSDNVANSAGISLNQGAMVFSIAGGSVGRFDSSGNLLVGTASQLSTEKVSINQTTAGLQALYTKNVSGDFNFNCWSASSTGNNQFIQFITETSPTARGSITYNRAGGLVAYNQTSDYRAKDINGPVQNALAIVAQLKPYMGVMKGATIERPMFIAHEAQAIAPYSVTGGKDAVDKKGDPVLQQMDHSTLVPLLTAAIQEQQQMIEELKAKVAKLENK